jgi:hypothetical protein
MTQGIIEGIYWKLQFRRFGKKIALRRIGSRQSHRSASQFGRPSTNTSLAFRTKPTEKRLRVHFERIDVIAAFLHDHRRQFKRP